jgi:type II secretion system protein G
MKRKSFTLIELLVVIAIIGLLSSIVLVSLNGVRARARDSIRMSTLKELQKAVELYYADNGSYPLSCTGSGQWGSHAPNFGNCDTNYIVGLSNYIATLPIDPKWDTGSVGYLYRSDGTNYTILAHVSMETVCGGDPSNSCNRPEIQQMDRPCCTQPTIAVYSPGGRNW